MNCRCDLRFSDPTHIWTKGRVHLGFKKSWFSWLILIAHYIFYYYYYYYYYYYLFIKTRPLYTKWWLCVVAHSFLFPAPRVNTLSPAQCHLTTACPWGHWKRRGADRHNRICSLLWICLKTSRQWTVLNGWSLLHFGPPFLFSSTIPAVDATSVSGYKNELAATREFRCSRCLFSSTSPACLSRDHSYSNLPRVEAGKRDISCLDWSLTTPP